MDIAARFGQNVARCRRRVGLSQEEVGFRASLNRTQVGILERGERLPRIDTLTRLAGALEASVDELLDGIVWRPGYAQPGIWEDPSAEQDKPSAPQSSEKP